MPKLKIDLNTAYLLGGAGHGRHKKDLIVHHETVSGDQRGLNDILAVERYLASIGYGIHGMTDKEGHIAWAKGMGSVIFYHCGGVNARSIGIEQVFKGAHNKPKDSELWAVRQAQLRAVAKLDACICRAHSIPIRFCDGESPGITSHWNVSQHHPESEGHWDCHPIHLGGYYPMLAVINLAKGYYKANWHF